MNKSDTLSKFAPAFIAAQKEVDHATKNAQNPHLKNKYANLAEVIDTVTPVFNRHGLGILQFPGWNEGRATVETMVLHESGEFLSGTAETPLQKQDPQGYGAGVSYLRRYSEAAVANISQEDDDAESAMDRAKKKSEHKGKETPAEVREVAKVLAKEPDDPDTVFQAIKDYLAGLPGRDTPPAKVQFLQDQIRLLHSKDQRLGREAYQLGRRALVLE